MAGVNKVILIGNLGKDPEVRHLDSGVSVCNFPIATTETYKDKDGNRIDQTEWHNIVLWRGLAEVAEKFLKKGNQVYIEGKLRSRSWEDKEGIKRYTTEVVGDQMTMLGGKPDNSNNNNGASAPYNAPNSTQNQNPTTSSNDVSAPEEEDDLPF